MSNAFTPDEVELMKSITQGRTADVKALLAAQPALSPQFALMHALNNDDAHMVHFIIGLGADPLGAFGEEGHTPLMKASWQGKTGMLKIFLGYGADINERDHLGYTALMRVAENGSEDGKNKRYMEALNLLLEEGADLTLRNFRDMTAHELAEAKEKGGPIALAVEAMQRRRAALTPAACAAMRKPAPAAERLIEAVLRRDAADIRRLIAAGASPDGAGEGGATREIPMIVAIKTWDLETVKTLLDSGAAADTKDALGINALMEAVTHEAGLDIVRGLIAAGADVNAADQIGETPMSKAAAAGNIRALEELFAQGARLEARDAEGQQLPLRCAARMDRQNCALFLLERMAEASLPAAEEAVKGIVAEIGQANEPLAQTLTDKMTELKDRAACAAEAARNAALRQTSSARQQVLRRHAQSLTFGGK